MIFFNAFRITHSSILLRIMFKFNVLVYVNDLLISGNRFVALVGFKAYLEDCFKMKDLGPLKYF